MNSQAVHIMVDAHVHIHEHFSLNRLFLIALQNFRKALNQFQIYQPFESFLLLTESSGVLEFEKLAGLTDTVVPENDFTVSATNEPHTLQIDSRGGQRLFAVNGKQIVTSENLEVLALGYHQDYPDGRPISYVLEDLRGMGCLTVLPWGAGKWLGRRGKTVHAVISSQNDGTIFLGDNGNRPSFWALPSQFERARAQNIHNLPGSDPLPFAEQEKKAGSSGFLLRGQISSHTPFASLTSNIMASPQSVTVFGTPESLTPFVKNQVAMQRAKRFR